MSEVRVGVIGLGFIGQTHVRAYEFAKQSGLPVRLVAVCDRDKARLTGEANASGNIGSGDGNQLFDPAEVETYTDPMQLIESDSCDLVSICTHTATHVDFAIAAIYAGKHVLVEKPVAQSAGEVERLLGVVESNAAAGVLCMPAMCMRFWPAWSWLKDAIDSERFSPVRSVSFARLGTTPGWSDAFYKDQSNSGGALLDLHIHDTDFVHHCFGAPTSVFSTGDADHLTTSYTFQDIPIHVTAEGCWDRAPAAPYEMRFTVCFRSATVVFDLNGEHQLVVHTDTGTEPIEVSKANGWDRQACALVKAILAGESKPPVTVRDAYEVMKTIEAERRSLVVGQPVQPGN